MEKFMRDVYSGVKNHVTRKEMKTIENTEEKLVTIDEKDQYITILRKKESYQLKEIFPDLEFCLVHHRKEKSGLDIYWLYVEENGETSTMEYKIAKKNSYFNWIGVEEIVEKIQNAFFEIIKNLKENRLLFATGVIKQF